MPRKRGRDALTGGTGNLNPQWYSTSAAQTGADTTTTVAVSTPPGIGLSTSGRPLAMEILKLLVEFEPSGGGQWMPSTANFAPGAAAESNSYVKLYCSSKNFGTTVPSLSFGDATVFAYARHQLAIYESTAASTLAVVDDGPIQIDMTDGDGHGVLFANQQIYLMVVSNATGLTNVARVKFLYREKYITEAELLGLVLQSNQN